MKKKLLVLSTLLTGMILASCGGGKPSSSTSTSGSQVSTSTSTSDSTGTSTSTDIGVTIPTYAKDLITNARTRKFSSRYDVMVNDFSAQTLVGQTTGEASFNEKPFLQVGIDYENQETFPGSPDASIYKQASGDYAMHSFDGIQFRMRVSKGEIGLENLVLGLRGDDAFALYEINLAEALDTDGEELKSLTEEYQEIIVSPQNSIDDSNTVYSDKQGNPTTVKVLEQIVGFHLYAKGNVKAIVEIESVIGITGTTTTVLDDFNRLDPNGTTGHTYWNDSTGHIVTRSVVTNGVGSYKVTTTEDITSYSNVVLQLKADTTNIGLTPVLTGDTLGTRVTWENMKDDENNAVVSPVSGAYGAYVVNLANSGITENNITGFVVDVNGVSSLNTVFMTNMEEPPVALNFPVLDTANAAYFDDFSRTKNGATSNYEEASTDPILQEAGLWYALSYNNGNLISVGDGHLTFDATNLASGDYIQLKEASKFGRNGHKYLVISTKLEDGATLNDFRIGVKDGAGVVYYNDFYAAQGIKTSSADNPYITADGYTWQVIDLALSGLNDMSDMIDIYYSGVGKLLIDDIFLCNDLELGFVNKDFPGETSKIMDATESSHNWVSAGKNEGAKKIEIHYTGNDELDLTSFRIEPVGDNPLIAANKGQEDPNRLKMYVNNEEIDHTYVSSSTEETVLVIDLEGSGWTDFTTDVTLTLGDYAPGYMDITSVQMLLPNDGIEWNDFNLESPIVLAPTEANPHAWGYIGWNQGSKLITLTISGDGSADLASFRLELTPASGDGAALYANNGLKIYDEDGNPLGADYVVPEEGVTITIDLIESGWTGEAVNINAVYGDFSNLGQTLTISAASFGIDVTSAGYVLSHLPERNVTSE